MPVIPEEKLLDFLRRGLEISAEVLPRIAASGTRPVPAPLVERFAGLIGDIHAQKRQDSVLCDESWEWIWEVREGMNHLQLYGRLAWLNYSLFDLL